MTLGAAALCVPGAFAEQLTLTPRQTEGPFYPDHLPLDTDNDLLIVNDALTPAVGEITHLSGRVLDARGNPIRGALVEIWQVDHTGAYIHSGSMNRDRRECKFPGLRAFLDRLHRGILLPDDQAGGVSRPHAAYPLRLKLKGQEKFTTQCYIKGEPQNERDGVLRGVTDPAARQSVIVAFAPVSGSRIGELAARFDIVMGHTPET